MLREDYGQLLNRVIEKKDEIKELFNHADDVVFFDELNEIIHMSMDGDLFSDALNDVLGIKSTPLEIEIDNMWDDYGGFFLTNSALLNANELIIQHYRR